MWRKRASGWRGGDGFRFVDACSKGGIERASAVDGQAGNIFFPEYSGFSCCFLDAHLATKAEGASLWAKFSCQCSNCAVGLDLADGAAIREVEIAAGIDGKAFRSVQTGLCAFGIKVIADCRIANKSGSGTIWLDFADDEVVGIHDINDTGIVHSNSGGIIEAGHSACSVHIAL